MYYINRDGMLTHLVKDTWNWISATGVFLMVMKQWIEDNVNPFIALFGALCGVVMLVLGILEKIKKNRALDADWEDRKKRNQNL